MALQTLKDFSGFWWQVSTQPHQSWMLLKKSSLEEVILVNHKKPLLNLSLKICIQWLSLQLECLSASLTLISQSNTEKVFTNLNTGIPHLKMLLMFVQNLRELQLWFIKTITEMPARFLTLMTRSTLALISLTKLAMEKTVTLQI